MLSPCRPHYRISAGGNSGAILKVLGSRFCFLDTLTRHVNSGGAWGGVTPPQRSENSAALGKSITTLGIYVDECAPTFLQCSIK